MNFFRETFLHLITPKRALINSEYLINTTSMINFFVGLALSLCISWCKLNYGLMFNLGILFGIIGGFILMIRYFSITVEISSKKLLPGMRFIHFENTHFVTKDTENKCCGRKSQFCGWVFGVTSSQGMKLVSAIKQEIHATIKGTKLFMLIPAPRIKKKHLFSNTKLSRDSFEYKRVVELLDSEITSYPCSNLETNKWGLKYPICITLGKHNKESKRNRIKEENRWQATNYSYKPGYLESKFKMFRCITKPSTNLYLRHSKIKLGKIFICVVTCREKELWLRYLKMASYGMPINTSLWKTLTPLMEIHNSIVIDTTDFDNAEMETNNARYARYMAKYMPPDWVIENRKVVSLKVEKIKCNPNFMWINAFSARLLWGLMEEGYLVNTIIRKLHAKIKKIRLPVYIQNVSIENVDVGTNIPIIKNIDRPRLNSLGWWCDFQIEYDGGLSLSLSTKVDLMKLRDQPQKVKKLISRSNVATSNYIPEVLGGNMDNEYKTSKHHTMRESVLTKFEITKSLNNNLETNNNTISESRKSFRFLDKKKVQSETSIEVPEDIRQAAFDSEIEDSSESCGSMDNVEFSDTEVVKKCACFTCKSKEGMKTQASLESKVLRLIEAMGRSKYFEKATSNKYIKKGIEMFANKKILLQLDVQHFKGVIVLHFPRPPSDRLWYGLRPMPDLKFSTISKIGERLLNFSKITDWIQKKVHSELEQLLVLPNMDDIRMP